MIEYSFSMTELECFMLIFCRVSCLVYVAPFFSMNNTPKRVRIGFSFVVAVLLYYVIPDKKLPEYNDLIGYSVLVLKEVVTGLLMGYSCNMCTSIVGFAGKIIDMEIGLSMVNLMDPITKESKSITGILYQYALTLLLIVTGMYQYIIKALAESFSLIPLAGAVFEADKLMVVMLKFLSEYVLIGFRICLPIFAVMILLNGLLGILAKVAPQMNMFSVGMQIKVLVGLVVLFLTASMLPNIAEMIFTEMKKIMVAFVEAMM